MGKIQILTKEQQLILAEVGMHPFFQKFYFTGGTALSAYYLQHRYSEDLDFFTEKEFNTQDVYEIIQKWGKQHNFTFTADFHEVVFVFFLTFRNKTTLKVDFGYYPHRRIKESTIIDGLRVDSLTDIAVNKLLTITQRNSMKDFVDLYFLLEKFTLWDLMEGVRRKFNMKLEPFIVSSDLLKVDTFDVLPRMRHQLSLEQLREYFHERAKELGKLATE